MDILILILGGAVAVTLIAIVAVVANMIAGAVRDKKRQKFADGEVAKWLNTRDNHTRDIASLRSEITSLKNARNGENKDIPRIWERLRELEATVKSLQDDKPSRSRRRDEDDDDDDDDRYARPRRSRGGYR